MIDIRSVLISVAAICFAGALGVTLGSGPLRGSTDRELRDRVEALEKTAEKRADRVRELERTAAYESSFATAIEPGLVKDKLTNRQVALVALPGADPATVKGIQRSVTSAGGTVTGTVQVTAKWAEPNQRQFLDDLSARLVTADLKLDQGEVYGRAGAVLARGLVTSQAKATGKDDPETTGILGGLSAGELVESGEPQPRGDLAVVVAPEPPGDGTPKRQAERARAWVALAKAMDAGSLGTVLAGPASAAGKGGAVRALRADAEASKVVSTVDTANTPGGQIVVAQALAEQAGGKVGQYGASGANGPVPK